MELTFRARILRGEAKNTAGIVVPPEVLAGLGRGKRPPVAVTLNGYTYRTTVGVMGGTAMIPLAAEHRAAAGLGDEAELDVTVALDEADRSPPMPEDFAAALAAAGARAAFDRLAPSHRKEHVRAIEEAKAPETRARRIAKAVAALSERAG